MATCEQICLQGSATYSCKLGAQADPVELQNIYKSGVYVWLRDLKMGNDMCVCDCPVSAWADINKSMFKCVCGQTGVPHAQAAKWNKRVNRIFIMWTLGQRQGETNKLV